MPAFEKGSKIPATLLMPEGSGYTVRLIKADQAGSFLVPDKKGCAATAPGHRKNPEVRLVATGPDYCDMELICGCGDVTRFRAWNAPGTTEEKGAGNE